MEDTVMKPTPGRRGGAKPAPAAPASPRPPQEGDSTVLLTKVIKEEKSSSVIAFGKNLLLAEANVVLSLIGQIRATSQYGDVQQLREAFVQKIRDYETRLRLQNARNQDIDIARFCLCCLIDETVLNTVWGGQSIWVDNSLLSTFYANTQGGEQFYDYLDKAMSAPTESLDILQLQYICMSLGFIGRYRLEKNGVESHRSLRQRVFDVITTVSERPPKVLSDGWQDKVRVGEEITESTPVWVTLSIAGAILAATYMGFNYKINEESNRTFTNLLNLVPSVEITESAPLADVAPVALRIQDYLATEMDRGVVEIQQLPDRVRISFAANELFDSGSAELTQHIRPVLSKVGRSLEGTKGRIIIVGHTDNKPIFTSKFPSNWHLSLARATSVTNHLADSSNLTGRLIPEGMGDARPLVDNDTEANRAKNRRVEIDLLVAQRAVGGEEQ
ncbi:putative Type IV / VI secretion system, DotU fused with Type VI secretion system, OmpA/MotB [Vibrio nigripulchritudo SOn1]|uniref:Type IV / VI secretion system, DotU fused with Type VI secretion system, OmpA/MotB n=1 Tax=Vibrio nigripulchritudo SOn1 TaxID=1238450 RepID=A0AAV2VJH5_9VIBR|nr:type VI secretion system protein TssL, long form [Vibrio nigripulchritudo]CCO44530.1 putative Type IV / VI secretion system, DotU fused with Type VI secretion system, OmpA/MotB [Vibrio nigripulchritudo SOn1]